jgi:hypothetical protein
VAEKRAVAEAAEPETEFIKIYQGLALERTYLIETVTKYWSGRLVVMTPTELVLADAAWVRMTGRLGHALYLGDLYEVEPCPDEVVIMRAVVTAVHPWLHELPRAAIAAGKREKPLVVRGRK